MVATNNTRNINVTNNRLEKYFVITPAVSIDRSHQIVSRKKNNLTSTALLTTRTTNSRSDTRSWCSLWLFKCFNVNSNGPTYTSPTNGTRVYQQNDNHFIRIDLPRKYRDKNCNITYEL